jgi:hypothetical protein
VEDDGVVAVAWAWATVLNSTDEPNTVKLIMANKASRAVVGRTLQKEKVIKGKEKSTFRLGTAQKL